MISCVIIARRYLIRQDMLDASGCIKSAVNRCVALWDSVYKTLTTMVREQRSSHDSLTDFLKQRDLLVARVSQLSLTLKMRPSSRQEVVQKLSVLQHEVSCS